MWGKIETLCSEKGDERCEKSGQGGVLEGEDLCGVKFGGKR